MVRCQEKGSFKKKIVFYPNHKALVIR